MYNSFCSKEYRFSLKKSSSSKEVAAQIRQTVGLKDDKPFNIKWLDIEGDKIGVVIIMPRASNKVAGEYLDP